MFASHDARHMRTLIGIDHRHQKPYRRLVSVLGQLVQRARKSLRLQTREILRQAPASRRRKQKPLSAVDDARPLFDEILVEQVLQHARQALFGDPQNVEQFGDGKSRLPIDEMQHAVMRAPKRQSFQQAIGIADEVSIGKEQQFDKVEHRLLARSIPESLNMNR
jgi:hypothetical protein